MASMCDEFDDSDDMEVSLATEESYGVARCPSDGLSFDCVVSWFRRKIAYRHIDIDDMYCRIMSGKFREA